MLTLLGRKSFTDKLFNEGLSCLCQVYRVDRRQFKRIITSLKREKFSPYCKKAFIFLFDICLKYLAETVCIGQIFREYKDRGLDYHITLLHVYT